MAILKSPNAAGPVTRRFALPRGKLDLLRQLGIWFGFLLAYQIARGAAKGDPARAFANGRHVINFEYGQTHEVLELGFQQVAGSSRLLSDLAAWTYWNSEFTVIGLALLWVYLRRHSSFARFRNTLLLANAIGLIGYFLVPTAPPRFYPSFGFVDTLAHFGGLNRGSGLLQLASDPYAAMPSLHSADALIVGLSLAAAVRNPFLKVLWLLWPAWVWFCVIATGNHFWLDVLAGIAVGLVAVLLIGTRPRVGRKLSQLRPAIAPTPLEEAA